VGAFCILSEEYVMGFDFQNFGIGLAVGWASAYGVYRVRKRLDAAVKSVTQQASTARNFATRSSDRRYITDLIEFCETSHLAGQFIHLSEIVVEPKFLCAPDLPHSSGEEEDIDEQDVFNIVPRIYDHPYLHTPYFLETIGVDDLIGSNRALAMIGLPGSGRTTAMLSIALRSLGHLRFEKPRNYVQEQLDSEEAALNEKDRAVRIAERVSLEERARQQLSDNIGITFDSAVDESAIPLINRLMPIYIHLAQLDLNIDEFGEEADPAEPLVRAIQRQVGPVTARTVPRNIYDRLSSGQALLLIDGYETLPENEREQKLLWLNAMLMLYQHNFFIVAAPVHGYGTLTQLGFTPVYLRTWSKNDINFLVDRWAQAWPKINAGKKRRSPAPPDENLIRRAKNNAHALSIFEVTLKIWASFADDVELPGIEGWFYTYIKRLFENSKDFADDMISNNFALAAKSQLDKGDITQRNLEILAMRNLNLTIQAEVTDGEAGKRSKEEEQIAKTQARVIALLLQAGLITERGDGHYQFKYSPLLAYLASLTLKDASTEELTEKAKSPTWRLVMPYAAMHTSLDQAVRAALSSPPDLSQEYVLRIARWLAYAPTDVAWRGPLLSHLGNMLIAPTQYPAIRERVTSALIDTRDPQVLFIFRKAIRSADPYIRRLACLGMGALGEADAVRDLVPLLDDHDSDVQLAAGFALGVIGTHEALEAMVEAYMRGRERQSRALAEAFADNYEEGHAILYDAIEDPEMMIRRSAVYGLRRIDATWAVIALYRAFLEDEQWYVRSVAQTAYQSLQSDDARNPLPYPEVNMLTWLVEWAAQRGESIPAGEAGVQVLLKALQEGDPQIKTMAAKTLGRMGIAANIRPLYAALRDRHDMVRTSAHEALADLQLQIGEPLPAPI